MPPDTPRRRRRPGCGARGPPTGQGTGPCDHGGQDSGYLARDAVSSFRVERQCHLLLSSQRRRGKRDLLVELRRLAVRLLRGLVVAAEGEAVSLAHPLELCTQPLSI